MKLKQYLKPCTKINSKWIKDLNTKVKTIKLLEENLGVNFHDLGLGNGILDKTPKAQAAKEVRNKLGFIKIKNFCF